MKEEKPRNLERIPGAHTARGSARRAEARLRLRRARSPPGGGGAGAVRRSRWRSPCVTLALRKTGGASRSARRGPDARPPRWAACPSGGSPGSSPSRGGSRDSCARRRCGARSLPWARRSPLERARVRARRRCPDPVHARGHRRRDRARAARRSPARRPDPRAAAPGCRRRSRAGARGHRPVRSAQARAGRRARRRSTPST